MYHNDMKSELLLKKEASYMSDQCFTNTTTNTGGSNYPPQYASNPRSGNTTPRGSSKISSPSQDDDNFLKQPQNQDNLSSKSELSSKVSERKGGLIGGFFNVGTGPDSVEINDQPLKGIFFMILYTLTLTSIIYVAKMLYELNPDMQVLHITSAKAFASCLILALGLNSNLKYICYDSIDMDSIGALAFKTFQSSICIFISYNSVKYFSVSTTGTSSAMAPLVTVVLAWLFLGEKISAYTVISILIVFSSVLMIIFGVQGQEKANMQANTLALVALCCMPLLLGGGQVAVRHMKKNHPLTITVFTNLVTFVVSIVAIMCFTNVDFKIFANLGLTSWLLILLAGILQCVEHTTKFLAFRYQQASLLQKLSFLPTLWNLVIDSLVFHKDFSQVQSYGFTILLSFYAFELTSYYFRYSQQTVREAQENGLETRQQMTNKATKDKLEKLEDLERSVVVSSKESDYRLHTPSTVETDSRQAPYETTTSTNRSNTIPPFVCA